MCMQCVAMNPMSGRPKNPTHRPECPNADGIARIPDPMLPFSKCIIVAPFDVKWPEVTPVMTDNRRCIRNKQQINKRGYWTTLNNVMLRLKTSYPVKISWTWSSTDPIDVKDPRRCRPPLCELLFEQLLLPENSPKSESSESIVLIPSCVGGGE